MQIQCKECGQNIDESLYLKRKSKIVVGNRREEHGGNTKTAMLTFIAGVNVGVLIMTILRWVQL